MEKKLYVIVVNEIDWCNKLIKMRIGLVMLFVYFVIVSIIFVMVLLE